jgi:hypothetical protein
VRDRRAPEGGSVSRSRSYRELQADAEREAILAAAVQTCPACGHRFGGAAAADTSGLPERPLEARQLRAADLEPTAQRLAHYLSGRLPSAFASWVGPLVLLDADATTLYLAAPAEIVAWVSGRLGDTLAQAASGLAQRPMSVRVAAWPTHGARTLASLLEDPTEGDT